MVTFVGGHEAGAASRPCRPRAVAKREAVCRTARPQPLLMWKVAPREDREAELDPVGEFGRA